MRRLLIIMLLLFIPLAVSAQAITVDLDPVGQVDKHGRATITGTIACPEGLVGHLDIALQQRFAKRVRIHGDGTTDILCTGELQTFEVPVFGELAVMSTDVPSMTRGMRRCVCAGR